MLVTDHSVYQFQTERSPSIRKYNAYTLQEKKQLAELALSYKYGLQQARQISPQLTWNDVKKKHKPTIPSNSSFISKAVREMYPGILIFKVTPPIYKPLKGIIFQKIILLY